MDDSQPTQSFVKKALHLIYELITNHPNPLFLGLVILMVLALTVRWIMIWQGRTPAKRDTGLQTFVSWGVTLLLPVWAVIVVGLLSILSKVIVSLPPQGETYASDLRSYALALVGLLTALGGLLGIPIALMRIENTERQTAEKVMQNAISHQAQIQERLTNAIGQLGATKTVQDDKFNPMTVPNVEARIGGLLALESLKNTASTLHVQIMNIFCSYIRENAREHVKKCKSSTLDQLSPLREDIRIAFEIIENRSSSQKNFERENHFRPDFTNADFSKLDLRGRTLENVDFTSSFLTGSSFDGANLTGSNFRNCKLDGASLIGANLNQVSFHQASARGANFDSALLDARTNLRSADVTGALFKFGYIERASYQCVKPGAFYRDAGNLSKALARYSFESNETFEIPKHWIKIDPFNGGNDVDPNWREWQKSIGFDLETFEIHKQPTQQ